MQMLGRLRGFEGRVGYSRQCNPLWHMPGQFCKLRAGTLTTRVGCRNSLMLVIFLFGFLIGLVLERLLLNVYVKGLCLGFLMRSDVDGS